MNDVMMSQVRKLVAAVSARRFGRNFFLER
jgi:hypothetical protein